jgi:hypothetical protein
VRRRLFNLAVAGSLGLCVAAVALWVRSGRSLNSLHDRDRFTFTRRDPQWWVISYPGRDVLCRQTGHDWDGHERLGVDFRSRTRVRVIPWGRFGSVDRTPFPFADCWSATAPHWMAAAIVGLPGFVVLARRTVRRIRGERRLQRGLCYGCGYDTRATRDRCPGCGTSITRSSLGTSASPSRTARADPPVHFRNAIDQDLELRLDRRAARARVAGLPPPCHLRVGAGRSTHRP